MRPEQARPPNPEPAAGSDRGASSAGRWVGRAGWLTLALLLAVALPLHACMPLWTDAHYYGVCGRVLLRGGLFHREVLYCAPPGTPFVHAALRAAVGPGGEALRVADLFIVLAAAFLLVACAFPRPRLPGGRVWAAVLLLFFYLSTTEHCHCQPDLWMLLPALAALSLRIRAGGELVSTTFSWRRRGLLAVVEGLFWGVGVLMKPFVALPALACWLLTVRWVQGPGVVRRLAPDLAGLLLGGGLVGGLCLLWEVTSGNWPYFAEGLFGGWARDYYRHEMGWSGRLRKALLSPWPWSLVHVAAVPLALYSVARALVAARFTAEDSRARSLLGVFYLAWFYQGNFLQNQLPYHQAAGVLLALGVAVGQEWPPRRRWAGALLLVGMVAWAAVSHPLFRPSRLALWGRCWSEGASPSLRDALALEPGSSMVPNHVDLEAVADFLRSQGVRDRELLCYNLSTLWLYQALDVAPATRFIQASELYTMMPSHRAEILGELEAGPQRFVVWDVLARGRPEEEHGVVTVSARLADEVRFLREPVVFRAGRYVVHRIRPREERDGSESAGAPVLIPAAP
jgi:hypothetical protein